MWEERQRQNARERNAANQDEKEVEIPDTLKPNRSTINDIKVRWFEFERVIWIHIEDFCSTMKYPKAFMRSPPRIHEQPWFALHRSHKYINADVLRRHPKVYCSCQQKAERATWDRFRDLTRRCAMSSSQNTSSST